MEEWKNPKTIELWIIIIILVVTVLIVSLVKLIYINFNRIVKNKLKESNLKLEYQKKLMSAGIIAQEQERTRIAGDLHDSLIGKLSILRLKYQIDPQNSEIDFLLAESIDEARRISHDLYPPMLEVLNLEALIGDLVDTWKEYFTIHFYKLQQANANLPAEVKLQLVRILQELFLNTYKHASASQIFLYLKVTRNFLTIIFRDNGKGFTIETKFKGIGLKNIELRVTNLNGNYKLKSGKQGVCCILNFEFLKMTIHEP